MQKNLDNRFMVNIAYPNLLGKVLLLFLISFCHIQTQGLSLCLGTIQRIKTSFKISQMKLENCKYAAAIITSFLQNIHKHELSRVHNFDEILLFLWGSEIFCISQKNFG